MSARSPSCPHCNESLPAETQADPCPKCGQPLADPAAAKARPRWFYSANNEIGGPVSSIQLRDLARAGRITPTDLVRREGSQKWVSARDVKGLFTPVAPAPVQPIAPVAPISPLPAAPPSAQVLPNVVARFRFTALMVAVLTLAIVVTDYFVRGGEMFSPGRLNAEARGQVKLGGVGSHAEIAGSCGACHGGPVSSKTMAARCLECHTEVRQQLDAHGPMHGRLLEGLQCLRCHTEHHGDHGSLTDLAMFDHQYAAFPLTGKHVQVDCKACHIDNVFKGTAQACVSCHAEPSVHQGKFGTSCASCHSTNAWKGAVLPSQVPATFDHHLTAFPLTGQHQKTDCKACHINNVFKGTARDCVGCHAEPSVHQGKFGTGCASCHPTATWSKPTLPVGGVANFDHNLTAFKLTGKHQKTDCKMCHINNVFRGTTKDCVGCHAEPMVHKGKFGIECASCHRTDRWQGAVMPAGGPIHFDHDRAGFKLTGKHQTTDCKACHINNMFKGTAKDCVSCHAEPAVHRAKFGVACATCHTTNTFKGAEFKHTFPLTHGRRRKAMAIECKTCHTAENNYKVYTCYGCHEHEPTRIARKHRRIANLTNCVRCHPTGREHGQAPWPHDGAPMEWVIRPRDEMREAVSSELRGQFLRNGRELRGLDLFGLLSIGPMSRPPATSERLTAIVRPRPTVEAFMEAWESVLGQGPAPTQSAAMYEHGKLVGQGDRGAVHPLCRFIDQGNASSGRGGWAFVGLECTDVGLGPNDAVGLNGHTDSGADQVAPLTDELKGLPALRALLRTSSASRAGSNPRDRP